MRTGAPPSTGSPPRAATTRFSPRVSATSGAATGSANAPRPWVAATMTPAAGSTARSNTATIGNPSPTRAQLPPA